MVVGCVVSMSSAVRLRARGAVMVVFGILFIFLFGPAVGLVWSGAVSSSFPQPGRRAGFLPLILLRPDRYLLPVGR